MVFVAGFGGVEEIEIQMFVPEYKVVGYGFECVITIEEKVFGVVFGVDFAGHGLCMYSFVVYGDGGFSDAYVFCVKRGVSGDEISVELIDEDGEGFFIELEGEIVGFSWGKVGE